MNELAFFVAGCGVAGMGIFIALEKAIRQNVFEADNVKVEGKNVHIITKDKKIEVVLNENSDVLEKYEFEDKNILVFNSGIVVCEIK